MLKFCTDILFTLIKLNIVFICYNDAFWFFTTAVNLHDFTVCSIVNSHNIMANYRLVVIKYLFKQIVIVCCNNGMGPYFFNFSISSVYSIAEKSTESERLFNNVAISCLIYISLELFPLKYCSG